MTEYQSYLRRRIACPQNFCQNSRACHGMSEYQSLITVGGSRPRRFSCKKYEGTVLSIFHVNCARVSRPADAVRVGCAHGGRPLSRLPCAMSIYRIFVLRWSAFPPPAACLSRRRLAPLRLRRGGVRTPACLFKFTTLGYGSTGRYLIGDSSSPRIYVREEEWKTLTAAYYYTTRGFWDSAASLREVGFFCSLTPRPLVWVQ